MENKERPHEEMMYFFYRDFSDAQVNIILEEVKKIAFRSLGRTIPIKVTKYPKWQFWHLRLSLRIKLLNNSRYFLHFQLHRDLIEFFQTQVPINTWVANEILVNGKIDKTAAARILG